MYITVKRTLLFIGTLGSMSCSGAPTHATGITSAANEEPDDEGSVTGATGREESSGSGEGGMTAASTMQLPEPGGEVSTWADTADAPTTQASETTTAQASETTTAQSSESTTGDETVTSSESGESGDESGSSNGTTDGSPTSGEEDKLLGCGDDGKGWDWFSMLCCGMLTWRVCPRGGGRTKLVEANGRERTPRPERPCEQPAPLYCFSQ